MGSVLDGFTGSSATPHAFSRSGSTRSIDARLLYEVMEVQTNEDALFIQQTAEPTQSNSKTGEQKSLLSQRCTLANLLFSKRR